MLALKIQTTNLPPVDRFPDYVDPFESTETLVDIEMPPTPKSPKSPSLQNKNLGSILENEVARHPSPQPSHVSSVTIGPRSNGNGHRILRSGTVGYEAPEFKGKTVQMETGKSDGARRLLLQAC